MARTIGKSTRGPPRARKGKTPSYKRRKMSAVPRGVGNMAWRLGADSMALTVQSYFEASVDIGAGSQKTAYTICVDPMQSLIERNIATKIHSANGNELLSTAALPFSRMAKFQSLYRQYQIRSFTVRIMTDTGPGLANPIMALTDRRSGAIVDDTGTIMSQVHTSKCLHSADRTFVYGWTAKTSEDLNFHSLHDFFGEQNKVYLKICQEVEGLEGTTAPTKSRHIVEVSCNVVLRDSKSEDQPLN